MQMKKLSDKEALAELAEWCRPFGLVPCVFPNMICVSWLDPDDPDDKWGVYCDKDGQADAQQIQRISRAWHA